MREATLGQRIRALRVGRRPRMSMRELGEAIGYTNKSAEQTVWAWEKDRVQVPSEDLPSIADALGVEICALFGRQARHGVPSPAAPVEDLTTSERQALDNIAHELVKLRNVRTERAPGRSTAVAMRAMLRDWRDLPADVQEELLAAADEIREAQRGE
jgi:transcriptional regulator with XRE-family HTH domain